jgi:hypothetical protein
MTKTTFRLVAARTLTLLGASLLLLNVSFNAEAQGKKCKDLAENVVNAISSPVEQAIGLRLASPGLKAVDQVIEKTDSVKGLLADPQLMDQYFIALQTYFGKSSFTRKSFDGITSQLKDLLKTVPEMDELLWRARPDMFGTATFDVKLRTSGRILNEPLWETKLQTLKDTLRRESVRFTELSEGARKKKIQALIDQRIADDKDLEKAIASAKNRKEIGELQKNNAIKRKNLPISMLPTTPSSLKAFLVSSIS